MITPSEIENKQFTVTRMKAGYDQAEVDNFLDRVANSYRTLYDRVETQVLYPSRRVTPELPPERPAEEGPSIETVLRLLDVAQQAADQQAAEAYAEAGRITAEANAEGERITREARAEADRIIGEAHTDRQRRIDELDARRARLTDAVQELEAREKSMREWLATSLQALGSAMGEKTD